MSAVLMQISQSLCSIQMHMDHIHFHAEPKYLLLAMTAGIESGDHERVGPGLESKGSVVQSEAVAVVVWCRRDETTDGLSGSEGTAGTCRQNSSRRLLCQTVRVCRDNRETLLLLFCDLCCSNIPKVLVWNCWITISSNINRTLHSIIHCSTA